MDDLEIVLIILIKRKQNNKKSDCNFTRFDK